MRAARKPLRIMNVRIALREQFAVAGKHYDPPVTKGECDLFVECTEGADRLLRDVTAFAKKYHGRVQPLHPTTWPVPLFRVVLPLVGRGDPFNAYAGVAAKLFQFLQARR